MLHPSRLRFICYHCCWGLISYLAIFRWFNVCLAGINSPCRSSFTLKHPFILFCCCHCVGMLDCLALLHRFGLTKPQWTNCCVASAQDFRYILARLFSCWYWLWFHCIAATSAKPHRMCRSSVFNFFRCLCRLFSAYLQVAPGPRSIHTLLRWVSTISPDIYFCETFSNIKLMTWKWVGCVGIKWIFGRKLAHNTKLNWKN